ncbi:hypothetical protein C0580_02015 [Candidatus Parcubacteria bacterium]|nr:MAG: hypothetical protein C0580_02015 [Candidatus Parcubacteria bacterium]
MKKTLILILPILLVVTLSGCAKKNNQGNSLPKNTNNQVEENSGANCFSVCHQKIQDVCLEEIIEIGPEELAGNSLMDPEFCENTCMANFTDNTLDCLSKISKCDQVLSGGDYCKENEIPDSEIYEIDEDVTRGGCQIPCEKYKKCAGYGTDATAADMAEAYNSCMEVCQDWSDDTITCINKKNINTAADCSNLSLCALGEYQGLIK